MKGIFSPVFESGFFSSAPVHTALIVGGVVAVVSAVVGTFTVMRGQSFAGHSLAGIGTAGGSGAFLLGVSVLYGFVVTNLFAAGAMELIGIRRSRGRDVATGIVLGAALGLSALFLYLDTTATSTTGATVSVLFGSIFTLSSSMVPVLAVLAGAALGVTLVFYRPLLLSSLSSDLAATRGAPVRLVGIGYLVAMALAVSLSAIAIGAILSTALLIGPPATALRLAKRPGVAILLAIVFGIAATWLGVLLAYDSVSWTSSQQGWPVSFFVVAAVFVLYLAAQAGAVVARRAWRGSAVLQKGA